MVSTPDTFSTSLRLAIPRHVGIGGVSKAELRSRLVNAQVKMNPTGDRLFADPRFQTAAERSVVSVAAATVSELGFSQGAKFEQISNAAARLGWSLCPLELGPHLRLQFTEQVEGGAGQAHTPGKAPPGSVTVASMPPLDEEEVPWGFYLRRIDGVLWLRGYCCWSGHVWTPEDVFVFVQATRAA